MNKIILDKTGLQIIWSDEDQGYIVEHPDIPAIIAVGDTPAEAIQIYFEHYEDYLEEEKNCNLAEVSVRKKGRPKKESDCVSYNVEPVTKLIIDLLSEINHKNQGSMLDELVEFYFKNNPDSLKKLNELAQN